MDGNAFRIIQCFQHFHETLNHALKPFIGKFMVVYFNDILIYSKTEASHYNHL